MKNRNLQKIYYHLRHQYLTTNNIVMAVALFIAFSWAWGSVGMLQRNYALQKEIADKNQQLQLVQLEADTLRYQQVYYKSDEYKELAVRQRLGLVFPGEKTLILPPNSKAATAANTPQSMKPVATDQPTHMEEWLNFLFGGSAKG